MAAKFTAPARHVAIPYPYSIPPPLHLWNTALIDQFAALIAHALIRSIHHKSGCKRSSFGRTQLFMSSFGTHCTPPLASATCWHKIFLIRLMERKRPGDSDTRLAFNYRTVPDRVLEQNALAEPFTTDSGMHTTQSLLDSSRYAAMFAASDSVQTAACDGPLNKLEVTRRC
jgi:hypothetical protein